jgi:dipeptidyl aminopeptidase/acylaminoacyl peptidase
VTVSAPGGRELYVLDDTGAGTAGDRRRLTDAAPDHGFVPGCERVTVAEREQGRLEALVYHPPDADPAAPDPRPLVLAIHGGPMAYDAPSFSFDDRVWTSRGYVVLRVNYRGSTSYGRAFSECLQGAWNTLEVEDLQAAVDWAVEAGWADPDRLFCTGFSQGGVNTGYLLTRTDRFAAAAAEHGVYDLRSSFGTDDSHNWLEADFGLPWENPEGYDAASAITAVDRIDTPLLVTAGENDWRCPPSQSEQLYVSVRKRGVPAKFVLYRDEHHAIGAPDRAVHRIRTLTEWFEEHDPGRDAEDEGEAGDDGEGTGDDG